MLKSCAPLLAALVGVSCASTPAPSPPPPEWTDEWRAEAAELAGHLRAAGGAASQHLVVRLAFAAQADLDLYVTDPLLETVYYANTPSRSGGALERDLRCDEPGGEVRVETIRFEAPLPGRYRVGVDYPHRCEGGDDVMPYALSIEAKGSRSELLGFGELLEFTTIVTEFEVD